MLLILCNKAINSNPVLLFARLTNFLARLTKKKPSNMQVYKKY